MLTRQVTVRLTPGMVKGLDKIKEAVVADPHLHLAALGRTHLSGLVRASIFQAIRTLSPPEPKKKARKKKSKGRARA